MEKTRVAKIILRVLFWCGLGGLAIFLILLVLALVGIKSIHPVLALIGAVGCYGIADIIYEFWKEEGMEFGKS